MAQSAASDGSSSQQFTYDSFTEWGGPASYTVGRLARAYSCTGANCEDDLFGYDQMGRVASLQGEFPSELGVISHLFLFDYDLAGNQTNVYYGHEVSGNLNRNVYTGYSAAGRPTYVATVYENGAVLANNEAYVDWVSYYPDGTPNAIYYDNGLVETLSKNNRLQLCEDSLAGVGNFIDRQYLFGSGGSSGQQCTPTAHNNGNIFQVADVLNAPHSQSFNYDSLNRLQTWSTAQFAGAAQQQNFAYDSFGNVNQTNGYPPTPGTPDPLTFPAAYNPQAWPYDANNRLLASTFKCLPYGVTGTPGQVSGYDAAGNVLCSGQQNSNAQAYIWDGENHLTQVWAQQNNNTYNLKALYSYDAQGDRIRADQMQGGSLPGSDPSTWTTQSFREYANFDGNVLSEMDQDGHWTDYIYGLGKKLASAPTVESEIQMSGSQTAPYNVGYTIDAPSLAGYVFRTGDVLYVRQIQTGSIDGGVEIFTSTGNTSGTMDSSGYQSDDDTLMNTWHLRSIPLTNIVGQTFSSMQIGGGSGTRGQSGAFTVNFAEISISSADGTVRTVYNRGTTASLSSASGSTATVAVQSAPIDSNGIHYFAHDQVGTVQEELSFSGLPIWKGEFAPFGQQLDANLTTERYKFTGKERDAESGLDYFGARYYASNMGRFMSPDWADKPEAVPYSSLDNPQSLNLYGYVLNNPLSHADADGHCCESDFNSFSDHPGTFTGGTGGDGAVLKTLFAPVAQFMSDHPVLTNLGINLGLAIITRGEGGEVAMPRLTEGGEAVPSAPSMGAAQRQAMQDQGIPTSQQPATQTNTPAGKQYTYDVPKPGGGTETKIVQRNTGTDNSHPGQPHVEAGSPKANGQTDSIGRPRLDSNKTKVNVKKPDGQ
jgi:RHS repeat-associated protein